MKAKIFFNGKETKELKYKKAQSFIETGEWKII